MDWKKIRMPRAVADEGSKAWENTLVGDFIGTKLPYSLVKNASTRLWGKLGLNHMLGIESGYFFFKFNSKDESDAIL